jgi:O-antigen/teichoic acid export membrane protein
VFVTSTDTIIISKFIGIVVVGKYVNYNYVTNAFNTLTTNLFNSFTSSIGNHNVTASREERYQLFRKLFFLNHVVFGFLAVCTWCLLSDFIRMFYGENMVLNNVVVLLLVLKF